MPTHRSDRSLTTFYDHDYIIRSKNSYTTLRIIGRRDTDPSSIGA